MDEIEHRGRVWRGMRRGHVGVFKDENGDSYAGEHEGGKAHGFGVVTDSDGSTASGQLADGEWHGHCEWHWPDGDVVYY